MSKPIVESHLSPYYSNIIPNGALIYSMNIVKNIIPNVKTKRNWVTIDTHRCFDNSIVFIHSNVNIERYEYLKDYKNLILVVSQHETVNKLKEAGYADHVIYLPLSIDLDETLKYKNTKQHFRGGYCYAGRPDKPYVDGLRLDKNIVFLTKLTHPALLERLNDYKYCYAVGLTAIEAKLMGCTILPFDRRYPDTRVWQVLDGKQAAKMLQTKIDAIDKK